MITLQIYEMPQLDVTMRMCSTACRDGKEKWCTLRPWLHRRCKECKCLTFLQHLDCIHHLVSSIPLRAPVLGGVHTGTQTLLGVHDQGSVYTWKGTKFWLSLLTESSSPVAMTQSDVPDALFLKVPETDSRSIRWECVRISGPAPTDWSRICILARSQGFTRTWKSEKHWHNTLISQEFFKGRSAPFAHAQYS